MRGVPEITLARQRKEEKRSKPREEIRKKDGFFAKRFASPSSRIRTSDLWIPALIGQLQSTALPTELSKEACCGASNRPTLSTSKCHIRLQGLSWTSALKFCWTALKTCSASLSSTTCTKGRSFFAGFVDDGVSIAVWTLIPSPRFRGVVVITSA